MLFKLKFLHKILQKVVAFFSDKIADSGQKSFHSLIYLKNTFPIFTTEITGGAWTILAPEENSVNDE